MNFIYFLKSRITQSVTAVDFLLLYSGRYSSFFSFICSFSFVNGVIGMQIKCHSQIQILFQRMRGRDSQNLRESYMVTFHKIK